MSEAKSKAAVVAGLFRKLRGRARLEALAAEGVQKTQFERELEHLKSYLVEWSQRQKGAYAPESQATSSLSQYVKSASPSASELFEASDGWAMTVIDAAIDSLSALADGSLMRSALRVRYLNEGLMPGDDMKIQVFRSGRLQEMSLMECDELADKAEISLVPMVKQRGLPL
jgi:hypothetical protein